MAKFLIAKNEMEASAAKLEDLNIETANIGR